MTSYIALMAPALIYMIKASIRLRHTKTFMITSHGGTKSAVTPIIFGIMRQDGRQTRCLVLHWQI
jgi:hypothetical protein